MKKKLLLRGIVGFPVGVAIGYIITIWISLGWGDGNYMPCQPALVSMMGNEIRAVMLQAFLSGLIGTGVAGSAIVWDIEEWSLIKQTGVYFFLNAFIMMPIAYFMYWMEHSVAGVVSYVVIFVLIFVVIWVISYTTGRYNVRKMNESLYKAQNDDSGKE